MKYILGFILISVVLVSCNGGKNGFEKHESGLEYKIVDKVSTDSLLKQGDVVALNMSYETEDGTVLFSSAKSERKYLRTIGKPSHKGGSFEDGMCLLGVGDSAIFRIDAESFLLFAETYSKLPKDVKPGDFVIVKVRVIEKIREEDYTKILSDKYHESEEVEMQLLEKYLANANITQKPTESGLYYIEKTKGTGKQAMPGSEVTVHYTVSFIDGQVLETSLDKQPFTFKIGFNQVIAAWDEGIALMKEGGKAKLIAPSKIAYGKDGKGTIMPYTTLVFEVELLKVK
jgi:FKBP-type peptidyl-prolyl cis-trans isomerase FkpA